MNLDFLNSKSLTHKDKLSKAFALMIHPQIIKCSVHFAFEVLPIFESAFPNEKEPRLAIEAALAFVADPTEANKEAAHAAGNAANAAHATHAASNAFNAAGYAAFSASSAAYTAAHAAYASNGAHTAASSASSASSAVSVEKAQINIVRNVLDGDKASKEDVKQMAREWAEALGIEILGPTILEG